jgi:Na+-driven multidrug efflux pump
MKNKNIDLMENAPVYEAVIKLALPTMLGMIAQSIYNLTDTFFIGMTGNPNLVAAISLAFPLFMITQGVGSMFAVGSASYISRKLGEEDYGEAKRTNAVTFYTTCAVGLIVSLVMLLLKTPLLGAVGTSADTFGPTDEYFTIVAACAVAMTQNTAMQGLVRSEGANLHAMIGMVLGQVYSGSDHNDGTPMFVFHTVASDTEPLLRLQRLCVHTTPVGYRDLRRQHHIRGRHIQGDETQAVKAQT